MAAPIEQLTTSNHGDEAGLGLRGIERQLRAIRYVLPGEGNVDAYPRSRPREQLCPVFYGGVPEGSGGGGLPREDFSPHIRGQALQGVLLVLLRGGGCEGCWAKSLPSQDEGASVGAEVQAVDRDKHDGHPTGLLPVRHSCGRKGRVMVTREIYEVINQVRMLVQSE